MAAGRLVARGGIVCQKLLSAPLSSPADFKTVQAPFLACVWELAVIGHERDAWVRNMMRAAPDAQGYLADRLAPANTEFPLFSAMGRARRRANRRACASEEGLVELAGRRGAVADGIQDCGCRGRRGWRGDVRGL